MEKKKFGTDNAAQLKLKRKSLAFFGGKKVIFGLLSRGVQII